MVINEHVEGSGVRNNKKVVTKRAIIKASKLVQQPRKATNEGKNSVLLDSNLISARERGRLFCITS